MHPRNLRSCPVLVRIESFHIEPWSPSHSIASFSQKTYRISDLGRDQLRILDACQSEYNPLATAASLPMGVSSQLTHSETSISGNTPPVVYVYPAEGLPTSEQGPIHLSPLLFSPTLSSILGRTAGDLEVWRLNGLPIVVRPDIHTSMSVAVLSRCDTYIATSPPVKRSHCYHPPLTNHFTVHRHRYGDEDVGPHR